MTLNPFTVHTPLIYWNLRLVRYFDRRRLEKTQPIKSTEPVSFRSSTPSSLPPSHLADRHRLAISSLPFCWISLTINRQGTKPCLGLSRRRALARDPTSADPWPRRTRFSMHTLKHLVRTFRGVVISGPQRVSCVSIPQRRAKMAKLRQQALPRASGLRLLLGLPRPRTTRMRARTI